MARYVDADMLETVVYELNYQRAEKWDITRGEFKMIDSVLFEFPTADVVEVVRCKDCIHFELDKPYIIQGVPVLGHEVCNAWGDGCKTDQNGFCFMGERRTDEID